MTTAATSPIVFDPYDYAFQEDPYPTYRRCRDEDPLHHNPDLDVWFLTRHADIQHAVRSTGTYSNAMGVSIDKRAWGPDAHRVMSFLAMDPPRQTRLRSLVSKGSRRAGSLSSPPDPAADRPPPRPVHRGGSSDWIHDFAGRFPMDVISEMMGVPEADRAEVRRLADLLVHREPGVYDVPPAGSEAALTLVVYFTEMVESRKKRPTEDPHQRAAGRGARRRPAHRRGDHRLPFLMVVAGNETTTKLPGNALFHLTRHPEQYDAVFADPADAGDPDELVVPWIEETLRHDTSSQMVARHLLTDVELHGRVAPAGSRLVLVLGSANRDDRVFSDPDRFDIARDKEELAQSLSFGGGRHFCLGANLARPEARSRSRSWRRVRAVEVDHDGCVRVQSINVRGFASVPVRMVPR